mgnify:CR=1 FL=1
MTTIVYDYKSQQIACDSRSTIGNTIIDNNAIKYKNVDEKLWFCAGSKGDAETFIGHYQPLTKANHFLDVDTVFLITSGNCSGSVYMAIKDEEHVYKECILDHNYATGSGEQWALAALDYGATAKEAVEYAMTKDIYSGGKVHVYDIKQAKFI